MTHHTSTTPAAHTASSDTTSSSSVAAGEATTTHPAVTQRALDTALAHVRTATTAMLADVDGTGVWEVATLHTITADLITAGATPTRATSSAEADMQTGSDAGRDSGMNEDVAGGAVRAARDALATIPDDQRTTPIALAFGELNRISTFYPPHTNSTGTGAADDGQVWA